MHQVSSHTGFMGSPPRQWTKWTAGKTKQPMPYPDSALSASRFLRMCSLMFFTKSSVQRPEEQDIAELDPEPSLIATIHATTDWVVPYMDYKTRGILPADELL